MWLEKDMFVALDARQCAWLRNVLLRKLFLAMNACFLAMNRSHVSLERLAFLSSDRCIFKPMPRIILAIDASQPRTAAERQQLRRALHLQAGWVRVVERRKQKCWST